MKEKRIIRYKDKIDFIVSSMESIPEEVKGDLEISGAFYKLHTSIESAMDLVAMVLKDSGKKIEDDYTNIESLEGVGNHNRKARSKTERVQWFEELSRS